MLSFLNRLRRFWTEICCTAFPLGAATLLFVYGDRLDLLPRLLLWIALVTMTAVLLRRGWVKVFGPVLFYDLVRTARRGRYSLVRACYALMLFLGLLFAYCLRSYYLNSIGSTFSLWRTLTEATLTSPEMA